MSKPDYPNIEKVIKTFDWALGLLFTVLLGGAFLLLVIILGVILVN